MEYFFCLLFLSDGPVAETHGNIVQMQQSDAEKNGYSNIVAAAGDANLASDV